MTRPGLTVIYDGDCPFCASYVAMMRLRASVGEVALVNARSGDPLIAQVLAAGHDLDRGMVVLWRGEQFFADAAVHLLASLSSDGGGIFGRVQRLLFGGPRRAARLYPVLAAGRRVVLRLLGRGRIGAAPEEKSPTPE